MPFVFANIFQPLISVFKEILLFFHDKVGFGWGLSIIAMTFVVRAALIPLTLKQFRSMQSLQRLSPEIKALQAKYKGDRQRLNQEMMRFYQENKVNPLGSCLPIALQFPVFISLYYMLRKDLKVAICPAIKSHSAAFIQNTPCDRVHPGSGQFLFIPDLTSQAVGGVLVVLIVLYIGSQLASSLLMTVTADKMQRRLMIFLPLIFVTFIIRFPAGLVLYWITTNTWTILQQYIVRRRVGPMQPVTATAGSAPASAPEPARGLLSLPKRATRGDQNGDEPARAGATASSRAGARTSPPPPPRRRKKRSGRRR